MKPESKEDDYIVLCDEVEETTAVLNYILKDNEDEFTQWNYVIKYNGDYDIDDKVKPKYHHLHIFSFEQWQNLPEYNPKDVAFKNDVYSNSEFNSEEIETNCGQIFIYDQETRQYKEIARTSEKFETTEMIPKQIIGYKLIKPEYKEAVRAIINREDWFHNFDMNMAEKGFNFAYTNEKDPCFWASIHCEIKKAGVLDIWFEEVYEKESITLKSGVKLSEDDIAEVKEILNNK